MNVICIIIINFVKRIFGNRQRQRSQCTRTQVKVTGQQYNFIPKDRDILYSLAIIFLFPALLTVIKLLLIILIVQTVNVSNVTLKPRTFVHDFFF